MLDFWKLIKRHRSVIIGIFALLFGAIALYLTFVPEICGNFECFSQRMEGCAPTKYINEGEDASWLYHIQGIDGRECAVKVTLLNAKEGDLDLRNFEGHYMTCFFEKNIIAYPERNLGFCHGILKEDLQELVIERLYDYVVVNLEDVREELLFR